MLREVHEELDAAVAEVYGWPVDIPDDEILERLVALNADRAEEEMQREVCWLRPEFQAPELVARETQVMLLRAEEPRLKHAARALVYHPAPKGRRTEEGAACRGVSPLSCRALRATRPPSSTQATFR